LAKNEATLNKINPIMGINGVITALKNPSTVIGAIAGATKIFAGIVASEN
jgi:hypothetical protein